jgi:Protein of unknown function (DUF4233)
MMRQPLRVMAASTLVLEALVVALAGLVAKDVGHVPVATALLVHGVLALACVAVAGLLRNRVGYVLGSLLQVAVLATGLWVSVMFVIGWIFALLWAVALVVGTRIERERNAHAPAP